MIIANTIDVSKTDGTSASVIPSSIGSKMPRNGRIARSRLRYHQSTNDEVGFAPSSSRRKPRNRITSTIKTYAYTMYEIQRVTQRADRRTGCTVDLSISTAGG